MKGSYNGPKSKENNYQTASYFLWEVLKKGVIGSSTKPLRDFFFFDTHSFTQAHIINTYQGKNLAPKHSSLKIVFEWVKVATFNPFSTNVPLMWMWKPGSWFLLKNQNVTKMFKKHLRKSEILKPSGTSVENGLI